MEKRLTVIDTTLRDGEQSAGVSFTIDEKKKIAKHLDRLGVDVIEAGIPVMGLEEQLAIDGILAMGLDADILTWNRMKIEDIKASLETGAEHVHVSVPVSDIHISKKLGIDRRRLVERYREVLDYALGHGLAVSVGGEDASRADADFLAEVYSIGIEMGVSRIRYADTVSVLTPFTAYERIADLTSAICRRIGIEPSSFADRVQIDFHGHNDFGLGTANALGAFKAGASAISCSVNGLGERAGNTALEEIVLSLEMMENVVTGIDKKAITRVSKLVENYSGRTLQASKPIVGDMVFSHEAGIHVDGLMKDQLTYTFLAPEMLGREHSFVFGKHSGKRRHSSIRRSGGISI